MMRAIKYNTITIPNTAMTGIFNMEHLNCRYLSGLNYDFKAIISYEFTNAFFTKNGEQSKFEDISYKNLSSLYRFKITLSSNKRYGIH